MLLNDHLFLLLKPILWLSDRSTGSRVKFERRIILLSNDEGDSTRVGTGHLSRPAWIQIFGRESTVAPKCSKKTAIFVTMLSSVLSGYDSIVSWIGLLRRDALAADQQTLFLSTECSSLFPEQWVWFLPILLFRLFEPIFRLSDRRTGYRVMFE